MANLHQLLKDTIERGAGELHVAAGAPPLLEIGGELQAMRMPPLMAPETKRLCYAVLTDGQKRELEQTHAFSVFLTVKGLGRFRAQLAIRDGQVDGIFRVVPVGSGKSG